MATQVQPTQQQQQFQPTQIGEQPQQLQPQQQHTQQQQHVGIAMQQQQQPTAIAIQPQQVQWTCLDALSAVNQIETSQSGGQNNLGVNLFDSSLLTPTTIGLTAGDGSGQQSAELINANFTAGGLQQQGGAAATITVLSPAAGQDGITYYQQLQPLYSVAYPNGQGTCV